MSPRRLAAVAGTALSVLLAGGCGGGCDRPTPYVEPQPDVGIPPAQRARTARSLRDHLDAALPGLRGRITGLIVDDHYVNVGTTLTVTSRGVSVCMAVAQHTSAPIRVLRSNGLVLAKREASPTYSPACMFVSYRYRDEK